MVRTLGKGFLLVSCLSAALPLLTAGPGGAADVGGTIRLTLGQQRVLDFRAPLEQVSIGDPAVLDVKVISEGRQVLLTAMGIGTTDLITWDADRRQTTTLVHVILKDIRAIRDEVRGMLGAVEGVRVRLVGERVVIDGEVFTAADMERVKKVAAVYPKEVTVLVRMSASVSRLIASEITRSLTRNGFPYVRAVGIGERIFLEGTVTRAEDKEGVLDLAKAYFDDCVNLVREGGLVDDLVLIDISFVEMGQILAQAVGVTWDKTARFEVTDLTYTVDILRSSPATSSMNIEGLRNFGANLELTDTDAYARTLAHPRLVCKSGEEAQFVAGGEIPIALVLNDRFAVEYKDYGIILKILPVVQQDGRISAAVTAESSSLDRSVTIAGYPGIRKRSVDTFVLLERDKVLTLSGLVDHKDSKDVDRVPIIGNFPVLGELFKSRAFNKEDTELVIFISARLMPQDSETNEGMIRRSEERYEEMGEETAKPKLFD